MHTLIINFLQIFFAVKISDDKIFGQIPGPNILPSENFTASKICKKFEKCISDFDYDSMAYCFSNFYHLKKGSTVQYSNTSQ